MDEARIVAAWDKAQDAFRAMLTARTYGDPDAPETIAYTAAERELDLLLIEAQWEATKAELDRLISADLAAARMNDPLHPSTTLLVKLGSAAVHAEEAVFEIERGGLAAAQFDIAAFKTAMTDPEIVEWRKAMDAMALLPVKR